MIDEKQQEADSDQDEFWSVNTYGLAAGTGLERYRTGLHAVGTQELGGAIHARDEQAPREIQPDTEAYHAQGLSRASMALKVLLRIEQMGLVESLRTLIEEHGQTISEFGDPRMASELQRISSGLATSLQFERLHGDGSLINLDDPLIGVLVRREGIDPERVAAARKAYGLRASER